MTVRTVALLVYTCAMQKIGSTMLLPVSKHFCAIRTVIDPRLQHRPLSSATRSAFAHPNPRLSRRCARSSNGIHNFHSKMEDLITGGVPLACTDVFGLPEEVGPSGAGRQLRASCTGCFPHLCSRNFGLQRGDPRSHTHTHTHR